MVQFVADDTEDENDNEDGRCAGWCTGDSVIDGCASCSSKPGSTTKVVLCGGKGSSGGSGGIGKFSTGPRVTCLKYVVR